MRFLDFINRQVLNEGGNATAFNKKTGAEKEAEKIDFKKLPIKQFREDFLKLFKEINKVFKQKYKESLWEDENDLKSGLLFNGSTSYIMNPNMDADEILKYKSSAGDLDVIIPEHQLKNLWFVLDDLEDKKIAGFYYDGCNKQNPNAIGNQINAVFTHLETGVACQVDFEALPYEGNKPSEFAKFGHSSSFEDAKKSIKAAFHKLLLRALVGAISENPNIVVATKASTPDKIRLKKVDGNPRMSAFSVDHGLRDALEPMIDKNGKEVYYEGKQVYKEIEVSNSNYIKKIDDMFEKIFKTKISSKDVESFIGLVNIMKKHCSKEVLIKTQERFFSIIFGMGAQVIESRDKELDKSVKLTAYQYFLEKLKLKHPNLDKEIERYYLVKWKEK